MWTATFYAVIHPPGGSKTSLTFILQSSDKSWGLLPKVRFKSTLPISNDILSEHWIGLQIVH